MGTINLTSDAQLGTPQTSFTSDAFVGTAIGFTSDAQIASPSIALTSDAQTAAPPIIASLGGRGARGNFGPPRALPKSDFRNIFESRPRPSFTFPADPVLTPAPTLTECPVAPVGITPIPITGEIAPAWCAVDSVNNVLWITDANGGSGQIAYFDLINNVQLGAFDISNGSTSGSPSIVYDSKNAQIVVLTYDGDIVFINPVTHTITARLAGSVFRPGPHMLAYDSGTGHIFAADNRGSAGRNFIRVIDGATRTELSRTSLGTTATDSITWCDNLQRVFINGSGIGSTLYFLFDPVGLGIAGSAATSDSTFNYECFYIPFTGQVLMSRDGNIGHPSRIVNIINGTVAGSIAPLRLAGVVTNTCTSHLFISDGNQTITEYDLTQNYNLLVTTTPITPNSLDFCRKTGLIYYASYGTPKQVVSIVGTFSGPTKAQVQNYSAVLASLVSPGGATDLVSPAWAGLFDLELDGTTGKNYFFFSKSIIGLKVAGNFAVDYPAFDWWDQDAYTVLYWAAPNWFLSLTTIDGHVIWKGTGASSDSNHPGGVYTRTGGSSVGLATITITEL